MMRRFQAKRPLVDRLKTKLSTFLQIFSGNMPQPLPNTSALPKPNFQKKISQNSYDRLALKLVQESTFTQPTKHVESWATFV